MKVPPWLDAVLARSESLCLDRAEDRAKLARAIMGALAERPIGAACGAAVEETIARLPGRSSAAEGQLAAMVARRCVSAVLSVLGVTP